MAKKNTSKKVEKTKKLNAAVTYEGEGELLSDISSTEPLEKEQKKKATKKKVIKKKDIKKVVEKLVEKVVEKTQQDIYNDILTSGDYFTMLYQGIIIYDSIKNKNKILIFKKNGFMIEQDDFPYSGLSIKFKK